MNFIFLGPPGAGKGTIAKLAAEKLGILHISTGDIFRQAIKEKTELGLKVQSIIEAGNLVPDDLTIALVKEKLKTLTCGYILDGFPRTIVQAENLSTFAKIDAVINFDIADEKVVKRLSGRRVCKGCGYGHHIEYMPPKVEGVCDKCGGELFIRKDDEAESIKNRLVVYNNQTEPLINFYKKASLLKNIDASNSPEKVLEEFLKVAK